MLSLLKTAWLFIRQNDVPTIWRALMSRDAHPLLQFVKYGLCGVLAAVTHNLIMATLSLTLFPAGKGMMADGVAISEALRGHNLVLNNAIAWPFGTIVAYWLNIRFVFTPGRHSRRPAWGSAAARRTTSRASINRPPSSPAGCTATPTGPGGPPRIARNCRTPSTDQRARPLSSNTSGGGA
jgi:putative flippase GtrA